MSVAAPRGGWGGDGGWVVVGGQLGNKLGTWGTHRGPLGTDKMNTRAPGGNMREHEGRCHLYIFSGWGYKFGGELA